MKKRFSFLVIMLLLTQTYSFGKNSYVISQNEKIDAKVKGEIAAINKLIYKAMCESDFKTLALYFSDSLKKQVGNDFETKFLPQMQTVIKGKPYKLFDEFFVKNTIPDSPVIVTAGSGDAKYTFTYASSANESYISMLVAGDSINEVMITLVYGKANGKWKINIVRGEDYSLTGKNAIDFFHIAHTYEKTGDFIDAINVMSVANHCSNPGGGYFKFDIADRMKDYTDTITFESMQKYPFPYTVDLMKTKPQVFNIHFELYKGDLIPMIVYQTTIYIKDTNALKVENDEMHDKIGTIFTGMDKHNKTIIYRTYNEKPNGQNSPAYYGFIKKNEQ